MQPNPMIEEVIHPHTGTYGHLVSVWSNRSSKDPNDCKGQLIRDSRSVFGQIGHQKIQMIARDSTDSDCTGDPPTPMHIDCSALIQLDIYWPGQIGQIGHQKYYRDQLGTWHGMGPTRGPDSYKTYATLCLPLVICHLVF